MVSSSPSKRSSDCADDDTLVTPAGVVTGKANQISGLESGHKTELTLGFAANKRLQPAEHWRMMPSG
jgi:hypothetical protein